MGHERLGFLPRTKQWNAIVEQLSSFEGDPSSVAQIANDTLIAIKKLYKLTNGKWRCGTSYNIADVDVIIAKHVQMEAISK
jgi:hypothetical protein